jgi:hypothetical protein
MKGAVRGGGVGEKFFVPIYIINLFATLSLCEDFVETVSQKFPSFFYPSPCRG